MRIVVTEFLSLDGVMEDLTGGGRVGHGGWTRQWHSDEIEHDQTALLFGADALLLGRATYEGLTTTWPAMTDEEGFAVRMNSIAKYVVSATLEGPTWRNSQVIGAYDPDTIRKLKDEVGDLYVSGSITLVRAMLADGLVDELHLCVFPLTRGEGPRLFPADAAPAKLSLEQSESYANGVVYLHYRPQT